MAQYFIIVILIDFRMDSQNKYKQEFSYKKEHGKRLFILLRRKSLGDIP